MWFCINKNGLRPSNSKILSLCILIGGVGGAIAQTNITILKSFIGTPDGGVCCGALTADTNLVLYGTTLIGGASNFGTVFRMNLDGTGYKILHSFDGTNDGSGPYVGVLLASDGNLYGTTIAGGSVSNAGTVFSLKTDRTGFATLHAFGGGTDGKNPEAALIEGSDGMLYGSTWYVNTNTSGTLFKIGKDGTGYSILHTFTGADGIQPVGRLLEGSDGALYGVAGDGGARSAGAIFRVNKDGTAFTNLYFFHSNPNDGVVPMGGLIEGSDHVLYGTCFQGGTGFSGTVFKINEDGTSYQILYAFPEGTETGLERPIGELLEGQNGALYGAASDSSEPYGGGIYKINKDGSGYTTLRMFASGADASTPQCGLFQSTDGVLYGTTEFGGTSDAGCVFALSNSSLPPRLLSLSVYGSSNILQFAATSGLSYDVERSSDLSSWSVLGTIIPPTNYTDLNPLPSGAFY